MSIFQTRSRSSSNVQPSPLHSYPKQLHHQHSAQQLRPAHQTSLQNNLDNNNNGHSSIDQDYSLQQHQQNQQKQPPSRPSALARPQLFSDYFRRYELMIEFTNLRNPHHCPSGVYVMPAADNMNLWFGTLFVHKGYYRNAVFKFQLIIPQEYPDRRPMVRFLSDMWHPLIDNQGQLMLQYQFPQWRPHRDYLFHVLHFIKAAFKKCVLDTVTEKQAVNKEAQRMYRNENTIFAKLAHQRAQLSITDSNLYDNYPANNTIKFGPLDDQEFNELKQKMMSSALLGGDKRSASLESLVPRSAE